MNEDALGAAGRVPYSWSRSDPPKKLYRKLRLIAKDIGPVELADADGDDAFSFLPANSVFEEIEQQLVNHQVVVLPEVTHADELDPKGAQGKRGARAHLRIEVVHVQSGESITRKWKGEAYDDERALSQAITLALKTFYAATFLIRRVESEPADRHDARARAVRKNLKLTPGQVEKARKELGELGFTDDEVAEMLQNEFNVGELTDVPRGKFDRLLELIRGEPTS